MERSCDDRTGRWVGNTGETMGQKSMSWTQVTQVCYLGARKMLVEKSPETWDVVDLER